MPYLVFIKVDPSSNVKEPISCLLRRKILQDMNYNTKPKFMLAYLRCQLQGG